MIRNNSILIVLALALLGAMSISDSRLLYQEIDELVEGRELEREELKEGAESGKDWIKLLMSGGTDYIHQQSICHLPDKIGFHIQESNLEQSHFHQSLVPLYLLHCSLRLDV